MHNYINLNYKFCCGTQKMCKAFKQLVFLSSTHQNIPCFPARFLGLSFKQIFPSDAEIFSLP